MKYRGKGKTKFEHGTIEGLKKLLKSIESWDEVKSIIPGVINKANHGGNVKLHVQYETSTGLKCIAKGHGAVQEVFFITDQPLILKEKIEAL